MNKTSENNSKKFLAMTNSILSAYNKTILELKNALIACPKSLQEKLSLVTFH